jgi:hypothetical protein
LMALRTLPAHPAQCKSTLSTMGCGPAGAAPASFSFFLSPPAAPSLAAAFFSSPMVLPAWLASSLACAVVTEGAGSEVGCWQGGGFCDGGERVPGRGGVK